MSTDTPYDSRADTLAHIERVRELLYLCRGELVKRAIEHDASKLEEPEKSVFDACTAKLKAMKYGTPEYAAALVELKPGLDHHYAANSHHPEHFPSRDGGLIANMLRASAASMSEQAILGELHTDEKPAADALIETAAFMVKTAEQLEAPVNGMSLFDLIEMLMDWKAATERMASGGDIHRSLVINTDRFKLSPQLVSILQNTINEMEWPKP